MVLDLSVAPAEEPLLTEEVKTFIRVDTTDEDELVNALIIAARERVEAITRRALITQTWIMRLDDFPGWDQQDIFLPRPPLQSISSITYIDTAGTSQTWAAANYDVSTPAGDFADFGRLRTAFQKSFPVVRDQLEAVTITFAAGYGDAAAVPSGIKTAMKLLISHWFDNRHLVGAPGQVGEIPHSVDAILWPYRALRF